MELIDEKKNKWIYNSLDNFRKYEVTCPHCGAQYIGDYDQYCEPEDFNYCPHCGKICNPANLEWEKILDERRLWYSTDISSRKADIEVVGNIHDNPEMIDGGVQ